MSQLTLATIPGFVDLPDAALAYRSALALAPTGPERRYLERRLAEISSGGLSV